MEHNELINQGIDDLVDGNESYAFRYMQGQLYANDIVGLNHLAGNEGLVGAIWEKIKQFCAWLVSLFTGKKDTGVATKETGMKSGMKVDVTKAKVTPVKASEIKADVPAPKAHEPTEEQKTKDKVTMAVVPSSGSEAKEEPRPVTLVMVPHNLKYLYQHLQKLAKNFAAELESLKKNYETVYGMRDRLGSNHESVFSGFSKMTPSEFAAKFNTVAADFKKWETPPANLASITVQDVNNLAGTQITNVCNHLSAAINGLNITPENIRNKNVSKEKLYSFFEGHLKTVTDQHEREALCKALVRYCRLDFDIFSMFELSDALSDIKLDIMTCKYLVKAPQ